MFHFWSAVDISSDTDFDLSPQDKSKFVRFQTVDHNSIRMCADCTPEYAVEAQTSLAPLSWFHGSSVATAHAHQCCIFQSYAKTVPSRMKLTLREPASMTTDTWSQRLTSDFNSAWTTCFAMCNGNIGNTSFSFLFSFFFFSNLFTQSHSFSKYDWWSSSLNTKNRFFFCFFFIPQTWYWCQDFEYGGGPARGKTSILGSKTLTRKNK